MVPTWFIALVLMLAALPAGPAVAQTGGTPPGATPAACQQLLALRDQAQKHARALQAAGKKKADAEELCRLFKAYLEAEGRMVKGLQARRAACRVPADVVEQARAGHQRASQAGARVCEAAAQAALPTFAPEPTPACSTLWARLSCPWPADR